MSFNYEGVGKNIAVVKNKNNEIKDKKVYMSCEEEAKNSYSSLETKANEFFQLVKDPEQERICLYIVGASGSENLIGLLNFLATEPQRNQSIFFKFKLGQL